jgi:hypothetical protein
VRHQNLRVRTLTMGNPEDWTEIFVAKRGSDASGNGSFESPYATLTKAMAAVTSTRTTIRMQPGNYTEADTVVWRIINGVHIGLAGDGPIGSVVVGVSSGDEVINIAPGATATSTFECSIQNIEIDHDEAGLDGIVIDNTSTTNKINLYVKDLSFEADSDTDRSVLVTHGNLSDAVRIYWDRGEIGGLIEYSANNSGDRLHMTNCLVDGGVTVGATAVATDFKFLYCRIKHAGIVGGHSSTVVQAVNCYTNEAGTLALVDGDDIAGSITGEVIIGS